MTPRNFWMWLSVIILVGIGAVTAYLLIFNEGTLRIKTEASFDNKTADVIPRGGTISNYNTETNILTFFDNTTGLKNNIIVDENTIIRFSSGGYFIDSSTDVLQPGRNICISLDAIEDGESVGALDVLEIK